jgi:hypothetical protein
VCLVNRKSISIPTYDFIPLPPFGVAHGCEIIFSTSLSTISGSGREGLKRLERRKNDSRFIAMLNGSFASIKHLGRRGKGAALLSSFRNLDSISIYINFFPGRFHCLPLPNNQDGKGRRILKKNGKSIGGEAHAKLWPASSL